MSQFKMDKTKNTKSEKNQRVKKISMWQNMNKKKMHSDLIFDLPGKFTMEQKFFPTAPLAEMLLKRDWNHRQIRHCNSFTCWGNGTHTLLFLFKDVGLVFPLSLQIPFAGRLSHQLPYGALPSTRQVQGKSHSCSLAWRVAAQIAWRWRSAQAKKWFPASWANLGRHLVGKL